MATEFRMVAERLCRIRGGGDEDDKPFALDDDGFLDVTAYSDGSSSLAGGALVPPREAARGALVLLGEPGVGKSTAFETIIDDASAEGAEVVRINGAALNDGTYGDLIGQRLARLPRSLKRGERLGELIIVLDQADESPMIRRLGATIRQALVARDTSHVRFLIACRTADYPSALTEVLVETCGQCVLADLAPLTREAAVQLCSSIEGVDGEAVIAAAAAAGAGALASVPLTLGLLVRMFAKSGRLGGSPATLFTLGVTELLDDHDQSRAEEPETTRHQRLAIAGRIAARLLLCGRHTIWTGRALHGTPQDLAADSLAAGAEPLPGGEFLVTKGAVRETLSTALFTGRGENRVAFRHSSMAAYLAASYIKSRGVPAQQLKSLFLVAAPDGSKSIPTMLRETAAWLVTLDNTHAEWLVQADPESLVGHSRIVDSPAVRAMIVEALLARAAEIELGHRPWRQARRQLEHPGLDDQLLAVLADIDNGEPEDWEGRARIRLAVRLAREAKAATLAIPLLRIAESDSWGPHMRAVAVFAAAELDLGAVAAPLRTLLERFQVPTYAREFDADEELLGALLEVLFPTYIDALEVLPYVHPHRPGSLYGNYFAFLHGFPRAIPDESLGAVLAWVAERGSVGLEEQLAYDANPDATGGLPDPEVLQSPGIDEDVLHALLDRALLGPRAADHVEVAARMLVPLLRRHSRPPLPLGLLLCGDDGTSTKDATELRRSDGGHGMLPVGGHEGARWRT